MTARVVVRPEWDEVHRAAAVEAEASGICLNAWVEAAITAVVRETRPPYQAARPEPGAPVKQKTKATGRASSWESPLLSNGGCCYRARPLTK